VRCKPGERVCDGFFDRQEINLYLTNWANKNMFFRPIVLRTKPQCSEDNILHDKISRCDVLKA
jgi:hypothetical protein